MKKLIIVAGLLLFLGSCYNDKYDKLYPAPVAATCDTNNMSFANDILPILSANCNVAGGCHDAAGATSTSGYNFTTWAGIHFVANANILINDINQTPALGFNAMPKNLPKIPQCDIDKITAWVDQGGLNN